MRKIHFTFLFCILFACKKNSVDPAEVRLLSITDTNSTTSDIYTKEIEYDSQGRIIYVSDKVNNGTKNTSYNVSYAANEIIIKPKLHDLVKEVNEIRYTVNSEGLPLKRIQYQFMDFTGTGINQKTKYYDTTFFEYNSTGLLTKITENQYDSTVYGPENITQLHIITTAFDTENGLLKKSTRVDLSTYIKKVGSYTDISKSSEEESAVYEYLKSYSNQLDYYNLAVMIECVPLVHASEYLNRNYKNIPDKITYKHTSKDGNGNITSTSDYTSQVELGYNKHGFLSNSKELAHSNSYTRIFSYNK